MIHVCFSTRAVNATSTINNKNRLSGPSDAVVLAHLCHAGQEILSLRKPLAFFANKLLFLARRDSRWEGDDDAVHVGDDGIPKAWTRISSDGMGCDVPPRHLTLIGLVASSDGSFLESLYFPQCSTLIRHPTTMSSIFHRCSSIVDTLLGPSE